MDFGNNPARPGQSGSRANNAIRSIPGEVSTRGGGVLARIQQSLIEFTTLTAEVRAGVDERLAGHLTVTGWSHGVLRITLDQPALATRWRFQEPALRRRLARHNLLKGLEEIRLVPLPPPLPPARHTRPSRLHEAPADALRELAESETHPALRAALDKLADAARKARAVTRRT